jgi:hypothetical protein
MSCLVVAATISLSSLFTPQDTSISLFIIIAFTTLLPIDGIMKFNGCQFPFNRAFLIIQCRLSQLSLYLETAKSVRLPSV